MNSDKREQRAKQIERVFYKAREAGALTVAVIDLTSLNKIATTNSGELGANARVALVALDFLALHMPDAILGVDPKAKDDPKKEPADA